MRHRRTPGSRLCPVRPRQRSREGRAGDEAAVASSFADGNKERGRRARRSRPQPEEAAMQTDGGGARSESQPAGNDAGSRSMIITTTENIPEARVVKTLG